MDPTGADVTPGRFWDNSGAFLGVLGGILGHFGVFLWSRMAQNGLGHFTGREGPKMG